MKQKGSGWKGESRRHSLARKGVKTVIDDKHRLAVNNFVARGNEKTGRSFDSEPQIDEFVEEYTIAMWFEDLPQDPEEQEKEVREWFKLLEEETGLSFQKLLDDAYGSPPTYTLDNPIDELFHKVEQILIEKGYDVYQSDTRMIVWNKGMIPAWYDTDYDEDVANTIDIYRMTQDQLTANLDFLNEKYCSKDSFDKSGEYDYSIYGGKSADQRRNQIYDWLNLPNKEKDVFIYLNNRYSDLMESQALGSTWESAHPTAEEIAKKFKLSKQESQRLITKFENVG